MKKIIMADGSLCPDESVSWWYVDHEDGSYSKFLDKVMDFTKHFPYWKELKPPKGYNDVIKIDDTWYWTTKNDN